MKCEVCGEEIVVVYEEYRHSDKDGYVCGDTTGRTCVGPRCGCYDAEGHEDCPYHICNGKVMRDKKYACPHGEPEFCPVYGTPFPCMLREKEQKCAR